MAWFGCSCREPINEISLQKETKETEGKYSFRLISKEVTYLGTRGILSRVFVPSFLRSLRCAAHNAVRAASESLVMDEMSVHVVIADVWQSDLPHASSAVNVPSEAGLARFRAAALSECCRLVKRPHAFRSVAINGCRALNEGAKAKPGTRARRLATWNHRGKDSGTESSFDRVNWGTSGSPAADGISTQTGGEGQKLGCGHSKLRGWRTEQPLAEPRATGRVCGVRSPTCRLDASPATEQTRQVEIATVIASKPACRRRRAQLKARLKPYWGKPAVRNFRGGRGNVCMV